MSESRPNPNAVGSPARASSGGEAAGALRGATVTGLADLLRRHTRSLHREAERSGVILELLQGQACRYAYALLLRNLLPAYRRLEQGLERHRHRPGMGPVAAPALCRVAAIESDLRVLVGLAWGRSLPLLAPGNRYADRVAAAADGDGDRLIAHAYTRYLGDLNGGRIIRRLLVRSLGLGASGLAFYDYPGIDDVDEFKSAYRRAVDRAGEFVDAGAVVAEAKAAFRLNIELSLGVQRAAARHRLVAAAAPHA